MPHPYTRGVSKRAGITRLTARLPNRIKPVLFLLVLAPVCGEYLIGYDDTIGNPAALIFGLFIFAPLYGAPAVLIREIARRMGRGWPTMICFGLAFGLLQAGLIDQSLFNPDYRDIPYWHDLREPTYLPALGTSAAMICGFLGTHLVGTICAPIALAESVFPQRRPRPWLGLPGIVVMLLLWAGGAAVVLSDTLAEETFRLDTGQLIGTVACAAALVALGLTRRRTDEVKRVPGTVPTPWTLFAISIVCLGARPFLDSLTARTELASGWTATLSALTLLFVFGLLVLRWSKHEGWGGCHVLAIGSGALVSIGLAAFTVDPLGDVSAVAKYLTNITLLLLVFWLADLAGRRQKEMRRANPE